MQYFLAREAALKWLETPSVYHIKKDALYELEDDSFEFLKRCSSGRGCSASRDDFINYCLQEGIVTVEKSLSKRPAVSRSPCPSLRYLELQITDECNLRCCHCYIREPGFSRLTVDQTATVLKEFEKMQGLRLLITGGEPLMHPNFREINEMLPGFFFRKVLFTNGLLLNDRILASLNADEIQVSIDGLQDAHDALRGKGTYIRAIKSVRRALSAGYEVSVSTMVHPKNLGDFDKMEQLFKGMGIKDWIVDIPCATGRLADNPEFRISPEDGGRYLKYGYGEGFHSGPSGFACGLHLMAVMANGSVCKCSFYATSPVGSIEEGLKRCWSRIKPVGLNKLKCDCTRMELCRGGCRYRALLLGDPLGKDLYKCRLYDII
jgi:radical SAM protein with 4Fe4S-binding SPASM domain